MNLKRGYTLVEMVISLGLLALLLVVIIESAVVIARAQDKSREYIEVNAAAHGAFSRFSRDMRRASGIELLGGRAVLSMKKDEGGYDTTEFYLSEGKVREDRNGDTIGDITPSGAVVSNLSFRIFRMGTTTAVRIEMAAAPAESETPPVNFYGTYVLRGSYAE